MKKNEIFYLVIVQDLRTALYQFDNTDDLAFHILDYFRSFSTQLFTKIETKYVKNWLGFNKCQIKFKKVSIDDIIYLTRKHFTETCDLKLLKNQDDNAALDIYYEDTKIHKNLGGEKKRNIIKIYFMQPQNEL